MDDRITLPRPPSEPEPAPFPFLAALAPVLGAGAMFVLLQSATVLLFALLGPLIAVASVGDARRSRRRHRRREERRWTLELRAAEVRLERARAAVIAALRSRHPAARTLASEPANAPGRWRHSGAALPVVLGDGLVPSGITVEGEPSAADAGAARVGAHDAAARLRERAGAVLGPVVVDAAAGIGVVGPAPVALALARGLLLQALAAVPPGAADLVAPLDHGWDWLEGVPHTLVREPGALVRLVGDGVDVTISTAAARAALPRDCRVVVEVGLAGARVVASPERTAPASIAAPGLLSIAESAAAVRRLAEAAALAGLGRSSERRPPATLALAELPQPATGLAACFLHDGEPFVLDLVADGPHAIIGGTTGAGKSELLIAWIAALAATRSTKDLALLLVDFKGGASFGPLAALRHCVGVMTDLDQHGARRAIESLRAELRRREAILAEQGARSIDESEGLERLVIVVDELQAMLHELPDLHRLFVDLAARGRSLGVHLVLCTQRPAEAARDAVLANCGIRISLRVTDAADAIAVTGVPDAAAIPLEARGRCVVQVAGGATVLAQAALADPALIAETVARSRAHAAPRRPWCDPLPLRVPLDAMPPVSMEAGLTHPNPVPPGGVPAGTGARLGLVDRPAMQRVDPIDWVPERDGPMLVLGSTASGRTTCAETVARELGVPVVDREDALWDALATPASTLIVDDVDLLLSRLDEEQLHRVQGGLARRMREDGRVVLTARRVTSAMASFAPLAEHRLLLRIASRQEHVVAGGNGEQHDASLPPGAGWLHGERVHVAIAEPDAAPVARRTPVYARLERDAAVVVVGAGAELPAGCSALATSVRPEDARGGDVDAPLVVGTVAEWEAAWGELERLARTRPVLLVGVESSAVRRLVRGAPPLPPMRGAQSWILQDGRAARLRW